MRKDKCSFIMKIPEINRLYIVESLSGDDAKTGKELSESLNDWVPGVYPDKKIKYVPIQTKAQFIEFFNNLYNEIETNHIYPIIHFENHGDTNGRGLVLSDGSLVSIEELGGLLRKCNEATGCRLFISLAVCHGLMTLFSISSTHTMPFLGVLGSLDKLYENDIRIRFTSFYEELFSSFDLEEATRRLQLAYGKLRAEYSCHMAKELFIKAYCRYLKEECTPKGLSRRAKSCFRTRSREERHRFKIHFRMQEIRKRDKDYQLFRDRFFLIDRFPQNIEYFDLPATTSELLRISRENGW